MAEHRKGRVVLVETATATTPSHHRCIGQLLVDGGFINQRQLDEALEARSHSGKRIGEILEEKRAISDVDTRAILQLQKRLDKAGVELGADGSLPAQLQLSLGQLLVGNGEISEAQLDKALASHQRHRARLGEILVAQKSISAERLQFWLGMQRKLVAAATTAVLLAGFATASMSMVDKQTAAGFEPPQPSFEYIDGPADDDSSLGMTGDIPDSLGLSDFQKSQVERLAPTALENAERFDLSPELVMAVIHTESSFNEQATSGSAAIGLMQVVPSTGGVEATLHDDGPSKTPSSESLLDPEFNIEVGSAYLSRLSTHYLGFIENLEVRTMASLAAYNWGPTRVRAMLREHGEQPASVEEFKQMIHEYAPLETQNYIERVEQRMPLYASYLNPSTGDVEATQYASVDEYQADDAEATTA